MWQTRQKYGCFVADGGAALLAAPPPTHHLPPHHPPPFVLWALHFAAVCKLFHFWAVCSNRLQYSSAGKRREVADADCRCRHSPRLAFYDLHSPMWWLGSAAPVRDDGWGRLVNGRVARGALLARAGGQTGRPCARSAGGGVLPGPGWRL